jgi:hypothetical protein
MKPGLGWPGLDLSSKGAGRGSRRRCGRGGSGPRFGSPTLSNISGVVVLGNARSAPAGWSKRRDLPKQPTSQGLQKWKFEQTPRVAQLCNFGKPPFDGSHKSGPMTVCENGTSNNPLRVARGHGRRERDQGREHAQGREPVQEYPRLKRANGRCLQCLGHRPRPGRAGDGRANFGGPRPKA